MQPHYDSCEQWHVRGPRVQQYLLYSNSNLNITVSVIILCWDLAVFFSGSIKSISSHLDHVLFRTHVKASWQRKTNTICGLYSCAWTWPRCFHVLCQKNDDHKRKICCDRLLPPDAVFTPSSSEQEKPVTSCSTSLVTLTWSQSHLQKKKKKKYWLSCIYLLDKCKGFSSFSCVNPVKAKFFSFFFFFWFTVHILFISSSVNGCLTELCDLPCLCEVCVCGVVCWLVSLKQYEWYLYLWAEMLRNIN